MNDVYDVDKRQLTVKNYFRLCEYKRVRWDGFPKKVIL